MKILLDTSFLISAMDFRIDIPGELMKFGKPEIFVLDLVVRELEGLSEGHGRNGLNARLSLDFVEGNGIRKIRTTGGHTDRKIITYARNRSMAVCTVDRKLKTQLLKMGLKVITIRQGKYLIMPPPPHVPRRG